jgi:hypothetical protein
MAERHPGPRVIPADSKLIRAAGHVSYEILMLIYTGEHLGGFHSSPMSSPVGNDKNMALESFLLHFRNLRAFLCPRLQRFTDDDIIWSDFLGRSEVENLGNVEVFARDKNRIDQMLAHLSYSRDKFIAAGEHGWHVAKMLALMLEELEKFLALLTPNVRQWFPSVETIAESKSCASEFLLPYPIPDPSDGDIRR